MSSNIALPKGELHGTGAVRYRCAACGALIEQDVVWVNGSPTALTPDTATYHPEHAPEGPHLLVRS